MVVGDDKSTPGFHVMDGTAPVMLSVISFPE